MERIDNYDVGRKLNRISDPYEGSAYKADHSDSVLELVEVVRELSYRIMDLQEKHIPPPEEGKVD